MRASIRLTSLAVFLPLALHAQSRTVSDAVRPFVSVEADLVVIRGDPTTTPGDIRNVVTVFRRGIGFDSAKLIESVNGQVGDSLRTLSSRVGGSRTRWR